jgi:hypothetical protein
MSRPGRVLLAALGSGSSCAAQLGPAGAQLAARLCSLARGGKREVVLVLAGAAVQRACSMCGGSDLQQGVAAR